jgi:RNA polymerase sigma-70 factor (ECF subfamily)
MIYVVVPRELAPKLHESLRKHFRDEPGVEVVVERRGAERRDGDRRARAGKSAPTADRRRIRALDGRRIGDRRVSVAAVEPPDLPRKARPHAAELTFVERIAPTAEQAEDLDTARLVTRIQAGDRDGYGELYLRYFDRVYAYLHVVLRDDADAEDVTQQVFLKVLEGLPSYERRRQPFRAWLFVIVRNTVVTELRKRQRLEVTEPAELDRRRERPADLDVPELDSLSWITDRELLLFVERLPVAQRQVLLLRFMLDLPGSEVARILGRSHEDVRSLQSRAVRFLEKRLTALGRAPSQRRGVPWRRRTVWMHVARERRYALK